MKRRAGEKAVTFIEDKMTIGLGSGTTVNWMLKKLGERVREGLNVTGVSSSVKTEKLARELGIPVIGIDQVDRLDLAVDGADEADRNFTLIKGGGGSLLREKMILELAEMKIIIVDYSKRVDELGKFPVPVEITPFAWEKTTKLVAGTGCRPELRTADGVPFVTDNGNYILDCAFGVGKVNPELHTVLKTMTGVVETGIFTDLADVIVTGSHHDVSIERR
jgi:ribose 5-phosphate isomerase A